LLQQEHAFLVGRDDIEQAVAVEVGHDELGADAALVIDLARGEGDLAVGAARRLEPVEPGGLVGAGLAPAVRPEPLPGDQVLQAVAIDVRSDQGVRLGDEIREEVVPGEDRRPVLRRALFEPPDAVLEVADIMPPSSRDIDLRP
jgi:hypothetical protein